MSYSSYLLAEFIALEACLTSYKGHADDGWYLDSGATHYLTNNIANMHVKEEFKGLNQLVINNGEVLPINHINEACFSYKGSNAYTHVHILLEDMLLVPAITKNLLSISKLTTDNNLSVEFVGHDCYVKDSLKRQIILRDLLQAASKVISVSSFFLQVPFFSHS